MEKFLKYIFGVVYIIAFFIFGYLICDFFVLKNKEIIAPIAITISAILASTAMARAYLQNARHEQQKIKRELFDRRKQIIKQMNNIFSNYTDKEYENALQHINEMSEEFYLIELLFEKSEIALLNPYFQKLGMINTYQKQIKRLQLQENPPGTNLHEIKQHIDINLKQAMQYYYDTLSVKLLEIMRIS